MVKLKQAYLDITKGRANSYSLREIVINPSVVSMISPCTFGDSIHLPEGLDPRVEFSTVYTSNGRALVVVGAPSVLEEKFRSSKILLKG